MTDEVKTVEATPPNPPRGVGLIGVLVISAGMAWWFTKDDKKDDKVDPPKAPMASGFVVTNTTPERGGITSSIIDSARDRAVEKAGTNWTEIQEWVGKLRNMMNNFKSDGTPKQAPESEDKVTQLPADVVDPPTLNYAGSMARAKKYNRPILILVGASWCGYCNTTFNTILQLGLSEKLPANLELAYVDQDKEPAIASSLKEGQGIPQLIYYRNANDPARTAWKRGQQTKDQILAMVNS